MPAAANPSDPRGIMRMLRIVPQPINQPEERYAARCRDNQSNSVACKETQKLTPPYRALGALPRFQLRRASLALAATRIVNAAELCYFIRGRP